LPLTTEGPTRLFAPALDIDRAIARKELDILERSVWRALTSTRA